MNIDRNQHNRAIDDLEDIKDQLATAQKRVYDIFLLNMSCEDTKHAYNSIGKAQVEIENAIARLE